MYLCSGANRSAEAFRTEKYTGADSAKVWGKIRNFYKVRTGSGNADCGSFSQDIVNHAKIDTQGHPVMAIRPFHKVYPRAPHYGHTAVSQGIPQGHPIMAIRPFHKV